MTTKTQLAIFMGVSGCGKSTLAKHYADAHNMLYLDADDYHSEEAKTRMQQGLPLTDEHRRPWINRILVDLSILLGQGTNCSLAYSGLKAAQRKAFLALPFEVKFVHLVLPLSEAKTRVANRPNHFFPAHLIESQYDALEAPVYGETIQEVDATKPLDELLQMLTPNKV